MTEKINLDRGIGITGLIISIASLFSLPEYPIGWAALGVGILMIFLSIYLLKRSSLKHIETVYDYEFLGHTRKTVRAKKIKTWRVRRGGITRLESGNIFATGECKNFSSNIGRISVENRDGGFINVVCDLPEPLERGETVSWVLSYDILDSFNEETESVSLNADVRGNIGVIYLKFSSDDVPKRIWKSVSRANDSPNKESIEINSDMPEIYWRFNINYKYYHTIIWDW